MFSDKIVKEEMASVSPVFSRSVIISGNFYIVLCSVYCLRFIVNEEQITVNR